LVNIKVIVTKKCFLTKKNWFKGKIVKIINSIYFHKYSKEYYWIQLHGLLFYSKYKNFNKLSIEFESYMKLNSFQYVIWFQICY